MLPLARFRRRAFSAAITAGFAYQFGAFGLQFIIAIFIEAQWGYSASQAGTFLLPFAVLLTIGTSFLNRRWMSRGMRWLLLVGSSIATVGTVLCLAAEADSQYSGIASGVLNTFRQMGLAVGVAVLGAILAGGNRVTDLHIDLAIGALCFLTVALLSRRYIHR